MKPHKNKIPFPFWGNGDNNREHETTQKQNPIPLLGEWDNNNSEDETTQKQDPIPLAGNGITRDTVPRGTVDPIPYIWFWQEDKE